MDRTISFQVKKAGWVHVTIAVSRRRVRISLDSIEVVALRVGPPVAARRRARKV